MKRVRSSSDTDKVNILSRESGDSVVPPVLQERSAALLHALRSVGQADGSFVAALEADRADTLPMQERQPLG